jgi:DNA-binding MarR family transcriptional regulator
LPELQAAGRLGVDRTTMVAVLDALEHKGLVIRHPDAADRRRNVVELTEAGRRALAGGTRAYDDAERKYLAPLGEAVAGQLTRTLQMLVGKNAKTTIMTERE